MQSYLDIGFDENLSPDDMVKREYISGIHSDTLIEGVDASQMMSYGKFASERGNWQIGYTDETITLPNLTITNRNTQYAFRAFKATVATDGTGDYDNIQDAIDYTNRNGGGTVFIAAGTYTIDYDINLYGGISLQGDGVNRTILDFNNSSLYSINLTGNSASDFIEFINISNISIINNHDVSGAIDIVYGKNLLIDRVGFEDNRSGTSGLDIKIELSRSVVVENCIAENGAGFINFDDTSSNIKAINNFIDNYNRVVFDADNTPSQITVDGNKVSNLIGSFIYGDFLYATITNNSVTDDSTSTVSTIYLDSNSRQSIITNNNISGIRSDSYVFVIIGSDHRIMGNYITAQNGAGVVSSTGVKNRFIGNHFSTDTGSAGVYINNNDNIVSGNYVKGSTYGVSIGGSAINSIVTSNTLEGGTGDLNNGGSGTVSANNT